MFDRLAAHRSPTIGNLPTRTRRSAIGACGVIPALLLGALASTGSGAPQDSGLRTHMKRPVKLLLLLCLACAGLAWLV